MKLQRAEEQLAQLRAEHDRFVAERNPYRMLREDDPEPGYYVWRAKIVEAPPLEKWGSLAGECVHALRSALDHVAYELVRINRPNEEHSEFPIYNDAAGWRSKGPTKLPGVRSGTARLRQPKETREEALAMIPEAIELYLESLEAHGDPIPGPIEIERVTVSA